MFSDNGNIPLDGIAEILHTLSQAKKVGSLLLVKDFDMCKLFLENGAIVHTEASQVDPSQPSSLQGEAGLRLIGKVLQWERGLYTYNADDRPSTKSINITMDWRKVARDLSQQHSQPPMPDLRATQVDSLKTTQNLRQTQQLKRTQDPRRTQQLKKSQALSGRGRHKTDDNARQMRQIALQTAQTAGLMDTPIRLKSSIAGDHGPHQSKVRNQVVGRGGGTIRTQTQSEDRRSMVFRLIDGRRNIRDLAVYLGWSIEDIKFVLAQLLAESAIDIMPANVPA